MASAITGYIYSCYTPSTLGQRSVAKSALTAATYVPGRDKRLVFASEWVFKQEGIRAVNIKFREALEESGMSADHEWDAKDMVFRVRCLVGDAPKISAIFSDIISDIVSESHGDDYLSDEDEEAEIMVSNSDGEEVPFKSDKVERISVWKRKQGITDSNVQSESIPSAVDFPVSSNLAKSSSNDGSVKPEFIWTCGDRFEDIASDEILKALTDLTGCDFNKDLKQGKLFIHHYSAENCLHAIKKLDNLRRYSEPRAPYVNHLFYTENIRNYQLRICPFIEVKKKFFTTTLLHPYRMSQALNYNKLTRALTVRCASRDGTKGAYMPVPIGKLSPVTKDSDISLKATNVVNFEYYAKGSPESHPMRHVINKESQGPNNEERPKTPNRATFGDLDQLKQTRIKGWAEEIRLEFLENGTGDKAARVTDSSSDLKGFRATIVNDSHSSACTLHDPFVHKTENLVGLNSQRTSDTSQLTNTARSLLDEEMPSIRFTPLQPLGRLPAKSSMMKIKSQNTKRSSQKDKKAGRALERAALVTNSSETAVHWAKDDLQPVSPDLVQKFLIETQTNFKHLMSGLQGFSGEVLVQAEFGRIILRKSNAKCVTLNDNFESFPPQEILAELLPNPGTDRNQTRTFFTNTLSTLSSDISYLVDVKDQTGQPIWERTPAELSLIYEISCHNERLSGWNPFTIEIDGETFSIRIKTRYDFGAVYVHSTLRHWDFRINAFGFGDEEQNETLYSDFAKAIQRSLFIPPNLSKPSLYFELDDSYLEKSGLAIDSILVYHVAKYKSIDKAANSILSVSEIRALDVDCRCPFEGATFQIYKAESPPQQQNDTEGLNVWHEASISSAKIDELLKQNISLELGEEAEWSPEMLDQPDAADSIILPACEMLRQMDGVGMHNDNGVDLRELLTIKSSPPKPFFFW